MYEVIAIIAAHLASQRFPAKVLAPIAGKAMLQHVVERTQRAAHIRQVVIALDPDEPDLLHYCRTMGWPVYVGHHSPKDVLSLIYDTARAYAAKHIVRVTADCPVIDPYVIDAVIGKYQSTPECGYCSNIWPTRTYPDGMDVEIFSMATLAQAVAYAVAPSHREHVTSQMQNSHRIKKASVTHDPDFSSIRLTVDMPSDLTVIRSIYEQLEEPFGMKEILPLVQ